MTAEWLALGQHVVEETKLTPRSLTVVTTKMIEGSLFRLYPHKVDLVDEHARILVASNLHPKRALQQHADW